MTSFTLRPAREVDVPVLLAMIRELAAFEQLFAPVIALANQGAHKTQCVRRQDGRKLVGHRSKHLDAVHLDRRFTAGGNGHVRKYSHAVVAARPKKPAPARRRIPSRQPGNRHPNRVSSGANYSTESTIIRINCFNVEH